MVDTSSVKFFGNIAYAIEVIKTKTMFFLVPFPELTKDEYTSLTKDKRDRSTLKFNKHFDFTYNNFNPQDQDVAFNNYNLRYKHLIKKILSWHVRGMKKAYKLRGLTIQNSTLPKDQESFVKTYEAISQLKRHDELYITAHGNPDFIAVSSLAMTAKNIVKCLLELGLSKKHSPHIILWCCNSSNPNDEVTLAREVANLLAAEGVISPYVSGMQAFLIIQSDGKSYVSDSRIPGTQTTARSRHLVSHYGSPITSMQSNFLAKQSKLTSSPLKSNAELSKEDNNYKKGFRSPHQDIHDTNPHRYEFYDKNGMKLFQLEDQKDVTQGEVEDELKNDIYSSNNNNNNDEPVDNNLSKKSVKPMKHKDASKSKNKKKEQDNLNLSRMFTNRGSASTENIVTTKSGRSSRKPDRFGQQAEEPKKKPS